MVTGEFTENERRSISIKRILVKIFIDDWPMKLVALVITFALYLGVAGEAGRGTFSSVPLNLRISDNADLVSTPPETVEVVLQGDKNKIDELSRTRNELVVSVDLANHPVGDSSIDLKPDNVFNLPAGVHVETIRPGRIAIKLEPVIEKDVPVKAETEGSVADGVQIQGDPVVTPQKVKVRGPVSQLKTLEFVSTERISVENRASDFTARQVAVTVSNPKVRVLDAVVDVAFRISENRVDRVIQATLKNDTAGRKIPVTVTATLAVLKGIKPGDLKVEMVDGENGKKVPRLVDLPPELEGKIEIAAAK
jgi:YbbR domain-containing protein